VKPGWLRLLATAVLVAAAAMLLRPVAVSAASEVSPAGSASGRGVVVLLRGGLLDRGVNLSVGMNEMGDVLQSAGIEARVIHHTHWTETTDEIVRRYAVRPLHVVLVGHSFGANAAVAMAAKLQTRRIPVDLVVTFDPTVELHVPRNVAYAINFGTVIGTTLPLRGGAGFHGRIDNVLVEGSNHFTVDSAPEAQARIIREVTRILAAPTVPAGSAASSATP
jgi:hypothetical protein